MSRYRNLFGCAWSLYLAASLPTNSVAQTVVWSDTNGSRIQSKNVSGGAVATIRQFLSPQAASVVHYDPLTGKLYYLLDPGEEALVFERVALDGSNPETLPTPHAGNFALNVESRKLHWITSGTTLHRTDLDGFGIQSHYYSNCCVFSLHPMGDDLFFGAGLQMDKGIWRADADGSNEQLLHLTATPWDLAFDPVEEKLYIATEEHIDRMNLDGSGHEIVVHLPAWQQLLSGPTRVKVDPHGRKIYWVDRVAKAIQRSNLDGSNIENFVTASDVGNAELELSGLTIIESPSIPATSGLGLPICGALILLAGTLVSLRRERNANSIGPN